MKSTELVSMPVSDQQKAKEFYLNIGYQMIVEQPMNETSSWIQVGLPGDSTTLSLVSKGIDPSTVPGTFHGLMLITEDINKDIEDLRAKGIEVTDADNTPWGKFCHFRDPDGNTLSLHEAPAGGY
ncbi:MAG: VOC family protein [Bacteroidota bacterium]